MSEYLCNSNNPLNPAHALADLKSHFRAHLKIGVVGARGYAGLELVRLLCEHPAVHSIDCFYQNEKWELSDYFPKTKTFKRRLQKTRSVPLPADFGNFENQQKYDIIFLATPPEVSLELAPMLGKSGISVIDLSHAFRFKPDATVYGLSPFQKNFVKKDPGQQAKSNQPVLIANPGCYASSVLMALLPILNQIESESIVIDAKSGTTGAGKKPSENLLFSEVDGECLPYRVGKHQHIPEVVEALKQSTGISIQPFWTTSLLNTRRGIISGIYAKTKFGVTAKSLLKAYQDAYENYPLVSFEELPETDDANTRAALSLKNITGTPDTVIRFRLINNQLYCFSLIDNLLKGAASQAIENLNLLYQFPVHYGLTPLEGEKS